MIEALEEGKDLNLPDGSVVPVRAIRPDDARALQRLHGRLSELSIRLRYHGGMKELRDPMAKQLACVDAVNRFALVALDPEKLDEIIAVVRFDRQGDTGKGEYAALVEDRWQGRGLGLAMTYRLIDVARDKGIRHLYGSVMLENKPMLKLLRSLDLPRREHRVRGIKYVEIDLAA
jgi:RimJ/RimL family protein N-acetyltransferase